MADSADRSYLFSYEFRGARYSLTIPAASAAEAHFRLARMASADFDGEVKLTVPLAVRPTQRVLRLMGALLSRGRRSP